MNTKSEAKKRFSEKFKAYSSIDKAKEWIQNNFHLISGMFENVKIRDFIFEPFKDVFNVKEQSDRAKILSVITLVATANAVMAGLPGKLLGGVFVSIGLEFWMAYTIAKSIGIKIESINDIWQYFGLFVGVFTTILYFFIILLRFAFSLFSIIPMLPSTVLAELIVTDFVGILFWFGFEEVKESGSFKIPKRIITSFKGRTKELYTHQKDLLKALANKDNLKQVFGRMKSWLNGEIIIDKAAMRGEIFAFAAMADLIKGHYDTFKGPMGEIFIQSIRRGYSIKLGEDASLEEISSFFSERTPSQLRGDYTLIHGEMFEHAEDRLENEDDDKWTGELHESRSHKGTDTILTNSKTGEQIEISYGTSLDPEYFEAKLLKYPDKQIVANKEMQQYFGDDPRFFDFSDISHEEIVTVTQKNFEILIEGLSPIEAIDVAAAGVSAKAMGSLWPFIIAFMRKRINKKQLEKALVRVLGDSGKALASRIAWAMVLGPVFAWYLLARSVLLLTKGAENLSSKRKVLVWNG